jgi:hypothetical protein
MENITPGELWAVIAWAAAAIVLLGNAADRIAKAWRAAKAPNDEQNKRLDDLEKWREEVNQKLSNDKAKLDAIQDGLQAIYQGQLAMLDHCLDGNNIEQMQAAKAALQHHLITHK